MTARRQEVVSAAVFIAATGGLIVAARGIEVRNETSGIDPRWWPELLGIAGLVIAVTLLVVALMRPNPDPEIESATREGRLRLVIALVSTVAFVLVWPFAGFIVAAPVLLATLTAAFGGRGWRALLLFPLLTAAFIDLLFAELLEVPL